VRLPSLQALGRIAATNTAEAGKIMPVLIAGLADSEGTVRKVAVEGLARTMGGLKPGAERDALVGKLTAAMKDGNPLVAQAAALALKDILPMPKEAGSTNALPPVPQGKASAGRRLRAGPVQAKFQDGELRYLCVGDREIVRRIYFAVRDERYDTVMPEFREATVEAGADSFTIRLDAVCSNDVAGFSWTGTITGTADGKIVFRVSGQAARDFKSPRVGLNVLYGAEALAGQGYELVADNGTVTPGEFPRLVSAQLLSEGFRTLRYKAAGGMQVSVGLDDGKFGMEDQRNFGDSSYKAFSGMPFKYMDLKKGEKGDQSLTIEVKGVKEDGDSAAKPVRVTLGGARPEARMPKIVAASGKSEGFGEINGNQAQCAKAAELAWGFNVAMHLPDDDTLMENIPAVMDQARSARSFAPKAKIRIAPVTLNSPYPRPGPDARCQGAFGSAWAVRMMKYLGCAGVDEAGFDVGVGSAAVQQLAKLAGSPLLSTVFEGGGIPAQVDVLAVEADGKRQLWVVNLVDRPGAVTVAGLGVDAAVRIERGVVQGSEPPKPQTATAAKGEMAMELASFEVCRLTVGKP
jgi:hypothetical protein